MEGDRTTHPHVHTVLVCLKDKGISLSCMHCLADLLRDGDLPLTGYSCFCLDHRCILAYRPYHPQFYSATLLSGALVKSGWATGYHLDLPDLALVRLAGYRAASIML